MLARYSRAEIADLWSDESRFRLWLEVEIAALEGMAQVGLVPESAVQAVRERGNFDVARVLELEKTTKHDVIAFLTNVAEYVGPEARYLHFGMTSSDLLDTTFSIQLCRATDIILKGVDELLGALKDRAYEYRLTPCVGRSHGIHAEPTTFGLKLASFYAELKRQRERVAQAREEIAVGAISGPVGTFGYLPPSVEKHLCDSFGLKPDPVSTQVISRDRHARLFLSYAELAATLERVVVEIRHLQRTEVREAEEYFSPGQKGSSAMPHKRNPVLSENITGLARMMRAWASSALENIALWHERDISHSSVERFIAPDMTVTLDFALARTTELIKKLVVYPERMKANLELTNGLVFSGSVLVALAAKGLSREEAYKIVQSHALSCWNEGRPGLYERLMGDSQVTALLSESELKECFSLDRHLRYVDEIFSRVFT
jgi:adenylosuccinate lyase